MTYIETKTFNIGLNFEGCGRYTYSWDPWKLDKYHQYILYCNGQVINMKKQKTLHINMCEEGNAVPTAAVNGVAPVSSCFVEVKKTWYAETPLPGIN